MALRPGFISTLSFCTGIGGLDLGVEAALGHLGTRPRAVAYCERNPYSVAILVDRMEEKALDPAPVWDDLLTFPGEKFRGLVDLVVAGVPCQPHSSAGKKLHEEDPRNLWPRTRELLKEIQPRWVFLENVKGAYRYFDSTIVSELEEDGWVVEGPSAFGAMDADASHRRDRIWLLAHRLLPRLQGSDPRWLHGPSRRHRRSRAGRRGVHALFAPGRQEHRWRSVVEKRPHLEPALRRVADGSSPVLDPTYYSDRIQNCGQAVVPLQAAVALCTLYRALRERVG
ncbi:MAG: DNA cytosine methyltransferase [Planctomycetota bacterium]